MTARAEDVDLEAIVALTDRQLSDALMGITSAAQQRGVAFSPAERYGLVYEAARRLRGDS